jgi:hypothetical protein
MRFTFIKTLPTALPNLKINKDHNDNLSTTNIGVTEANAYFTCGDIVFNYNTISGEVVSVDGYLPYFDTLPINDSLVLPGRTIDGRLFVGDLTGDPIFAIDDLAIEVSTDKRIIHAGKNTSEEVIEMSKSVYVGLKDAVIRDIYLHLDK